MTKGDWARQLSNKALAQYMTTFSYNMCDSCYYNDGNCAPKHCIQAWEDWLNEEFKTGMSKEDLDKLRELLCDFDCTYALDKNKAEAVDKVIDIIASIMEVDHGND
jgi:hypothetical protein